MFNLVQRNVCNDVVDIHLRVCFQKQNMWRGQKKERRKKDLCHSRNRDDTVGRALDKRERETALGDVSALLLLLGHPQPQPAERSEWSRVESSVLKS